MYWTRKRTNIIKQEPEIKNKPSETLENTKLETNQYRAWLWIFLKSKGMKRVQNKISKHTQDPGQNCIHSQHIKKTKQKTPWSLHENIHSHMKYISNRKVCNLTLQVPSHNEILCKAHILDYKTRQYSRNSRAVLGQLRPLCVLCVCCRNCPCRSSFRVVFRGWKMLAAR